MNETSCQSILNEYISKLLIAISENDLIFDVLSGMINDSIDFNTSDIDIICKTDFDLSKIRSLAKTILLEFKDLSLVLDRSSRPGGRHLIVSCKNITVMLDLFVDLKFFNICLIKSDIYFEIKSDGIDPKPIVSFLKHKTGYKDASPGIPTAFLRLEKVNLSITKKITHYYLKYMYIFKQLFGKKSGIFVVFLSPDGGGKTSVITAIRADYQGQRTIIPFREFHYRATLRNRSDSSPVLDPHSGVERGALMSVIKIVYLLFAFWLGYLFKVIYPLQRDFIVIFDRYYHDMLVDPKRYRYSEPMWLARLVGRLIPQPDLWILLDAPAEVLQSRKQEVPFEETVRQRQGYLDLVRSFKNSFVIDASQPLREVVADVSCVLLNCMAEKTEKRFAK